MFKIDSDFKNAQKIQKQFFVIPINAPELFALNCLY